MNPEAFAAAMLGLPRDKEGDSISPAVAAFRLRDQYKALTTRHQFEPGQLVQKKPGFATNYRYPKEGYPAVVTELIDPPYIDPNVGESRPECMLKHDVRIAMLTESCHLIELVYCGAYLEPYTGEIEPGSGSGTSG